MAKRKTAEAPAMNPKLWALDQIIPYHSNPRTHPPEQVALLAKLLVRHGVDQPIVVDEDGVILKGHGRRLAAYEAGLTEFPVVQRTDLSDIEKRALRIEDNQVALLSTWDHELIRGEIANLQTAGYEVALLGFGDVDLVHFTTVPGPLSTDNRATVGNLAERFGIAPFTTLNAREGWWQNRKRGWLSIGIQSELGRGETAGAGLTISKTIQSLKPSADQAAKRSRKANATPGGSKLPAADYSKSKKRGDGRGRAVS